MLRFLLVASSAMPAGLALAQPLVGVGLQRVNYYSTQAVFTDATNHLQPLFAQRIGADWAQADPGSVSFNAQGYPTTIAPGHVVQGLWSVPEGYPRGNHVLLWDGEGEVQPLFAAAGDIISAVPGRVEFRLPPDSRTGEGDDRGVLITSTSPSNPVRNIRLVPVEREPDYTGQSPVSPFRQAFVESYPWAGSFRYKDWAVIDDENPITDWSTRPLPTDSTQGTLDRGVALEHMISHANQTNTHPWINIPHRATDDYVRNAATLIRDTLHQDLAVRIEYSNEVWNTIYPQYEYSRQQAATIGLPQDYEGALSFYAHRSSQVFDIFEDVFTQGGSNPAGMERLVRVLASHAANDFSTHTILAYNNAYQNADALAIAPYFGGPVAANPGDFDFDPGTRSAADWKAASWEERFAWVEEDLQTAFEFIDAHADLLSDTTNEQGEPIYANLMLFAYEGGQHYVNWFDTHEDDELTNLLFELNRRPEMRDLYRRYLEHWAEAGGQDFIHYTAMDRSTIYGSWGLLEYEGQPLSTAPKLQGVLDFINGQSVPEPGSLGVLLPTGNLLLRRRSRF